MQVNLHPDDFYIVTLNAERNKTSFAFKYFGNLREKSGNIIDPSHYYCKACLDEAQQKSQETSKKQGN